MVEEPRVLGMIGCLVLADELKYLLEGDDEIDRVMVLDNLEGRVLLKKLARSSVGPRAVAVGEDGLDDHRFTGYSIIIRMLPSTLHDTPASSSPASTRSSGSWAGTWARPS